MNVLFVDDPFLDGEAIRKSIMSLGFKSVDTVSNFVEVSSSLQEKEYELIVFNLEQVQDALSEIKKAKDKNGRIKVLVLSKDNRKETILSAIRNGVDEYVIIPISIERLTDRFMSIKNKIESSLCESTIMSAMSKILENKEGKKRLLFF